MRIFDFERIPILEAAKLCRIRVTGDLCKTEVYAVCPFCGDGRKHFSMNKYDDTYHCFKCNAGGNSITLYGDLSGVDYKTAYSDLTNGCTLSGNGNAEHEAKPKVNARTLAERHDVYYDLLTILKLSGAHKNNLRNRGLGSDFIDSKMYRSTPSWKSSAEIAEKLSRSHNLHGIPGFFTKDGKWQMYCPKGFFIPLCDKDGYIQGMQIRLDDNNKKGRYRSFGSSDMQNGAKFSTDWYHVSGGIDGSTINLTEGGLKADVAYYLSGKPFVGLIGVSCISGLIHWLISHKINHVNDYWDMDKTYKPAVMLQHKKLLSMLSEYGYSYTSWVWDSYMGITEWNGLSENNGSIFSEELKGIDNYYYEQNRLLAAA